MIYFNKIFKIPGPKDLGMSSSNHFMSMEGFCDEGDSTWEMYYSKVKKEYPIKYFLSAQLPEFFIRIYHKVWWPIRDIIYWVKCHTLSKYRYHMLDLRQPGKKADPYLTDINSYRYGWIDTDNRMLFAIFNLLNEYMKKEFKYRYLPTEEDIINDPNLKQQREDMLESQAIYNWWNKDRLEEMKKITEAQDIWHELRFEKKDKLGSEEPWKNLRKLEEDFENKTDEMITRLMRIRRSLWS